jgi:hypothetical protein
MVVSIKGASVVGCPEADAKRRTDGNIISSGEIEGSVLLRCPDHRLVVIGLT